MSPKYKKALKRASDSGIIKQIPFYLGNYAAITKEAHVLQEVIPLGILKCVTAGFPEKRGPKAWDCSRKIYIEAKITTT
jgi:hypothetical protein